MEYHLRHLMTHGALHRSCPEIGHDMGVPEVGHGERHD